MPRQRQTAASAVGAAPHDFLSQMMEHYQLENCHE